VPPSMLKKLQWWWCDRDQVWGELYCNHHIGRGFKCGYVEVPTNQEEYEQE
jgi:hypothetical protein